MTQKHESCKWEDGLYNILSLNFDLTRKLHRKLNVYLTSYKLFTCFTLSSSFRERLLSSRHQQTRLRGSNSHNHISGHVTREETTCLWRTTTQPWWDSIWVKGQLLCSGVGKESKGRASGLKIHRQSTCTASQGRASINEKLRAALVVLRGFTETLSCSHRQRWWSAGQRWS